MRVLVISPEIPVPPIGGGATRTFHLVQALAQRHTVTVVALDRSWATGPMPRSRLSPMNAALVPVSPRDLPTFMVEDRRPIQRAYERLATESDEPWLAHSIRSRDMWDSIARLSGQADLILIEHSRMATYLGAMPNTTPKILDFHNVHSLMEARVESSTADLAQSSRANVARVRRFERNAAAACVCSLTVSAVEARAAEDYLDISTVVIPNGVDLDYFRPGRSSTTSNVLFTGLMAYAPNVDAVEYFVGEIWPKVRIECADAMFHVVGAGGTKLGVDDVTRVVYHGYVPSTLPHFNRASVVVVPLRYGGGTRLKILEAAACGKAIVSSRIGAEGLEFADKRDLMIADDAEGFAASVIPLLQSKRNRDQLGASARLAARPYDWRRVGRKLLGLVEAYAS